MASPANGSIAVRIVAEVRGRSPDWTVADSVQCGPRAPAPSRRHRRSGNRASHRHRGAQALPRLLPDSSASTRGGDTCWRGSGAHDACRSDSASTQARPSGPITPSRSAMAVGGSTRALRAEVRRQTMMPLRGRRSIVQTQRQRRQRDERHRVGSVVRRETGADRSDVVRKKA